MSAIDHQQAAIDQVAEILHDWFGCSPGGEASPGCECDPEPYESDAEHILTAATPHLRAAWAAELGATFQSGERWNATYRKGLRTLQYENAYLDGVIDIITLLEGGGE